MKGGTHVNHVMEQMVEAILKKVKAQNKGGIEIKPAHVTLDYNFSHDFYLQGSNIKSEFWRCAEFGQTLIWLPKAA